jgi:hypothetical protein
MSFICDTAKSCSDAFRWRLVGVVDDSDDILDIEAFYRTTLSIVVLKFARLINGGSSNTSLTICHSVLFLHIFMELHTSLSCLKTMHLFETWGLCVYCHIERMVRKVVLIHHYQCQLLTRPFVEVFQCKCQCNSSRCLYCREYVRYACLAMGGLRLY